MSCHCHFVSCVEKSNKKCHVSFASKIVNSFRLSWVIFVTSSGPAFVSVSLKIKYSFKYKTIYK